MQSITNNLFKYSTLYKTQENAPRRQISFKGVTDTFRKNFVTTYTEMVQEFSKDTASRGIAGELPPYWLAKLEGRNDKKEVVEKSNN